MTRRSCLLLAAARRAPAAAVTFSSLFHGERGGTEPAKPAVATVTNPASRDAAKRWLRPEHAAAAATVDESSHRLLIAFAGAAGASGTNIRIVHIEAETDLLRFTVVLTHADVGRAGFHSAYHGVTVARAEWDRIAPRGWILATREHRELAHGNF